MTVRHLPQQIPKHLINDLINFMLHANYYRYFQLDLIGLH